MEPVAESRASTDGPAEKRSLDPQRQAARDPRQIGALLHAAGASQAALVEDGLVEIRAAIRRAFPDNLFEDLDHLAFAIAREADRDGDPARHARGAIETVMSLMHLFGGGTPIRFRYVHDFVYGYDWARWVKKDVAARGEVGPFDRVFLDRMVRRGNELLSLIDANDDKYPRLTDERPRNPFGFSREPVDEARLFSDLATEGLLPVESWRLEAEPSWEKDFAGLRLARAHVLGLALPA